MHVDNARIILQRRGFQITTDDPLLTMVLLNDVVLKGVLNPYLAADIDDMQAILQSRGIRVRNDDPIFTLLALNGIVLLDALYVVRSAGLKLQIKGKTAAFLSFLIAFSVALGAGIFIGADQVAPSLVLAASVSVMLGLALGAIGMLLITRKNESR